MNTSDNKDKLLPFDSIRNLIFANISKGGDVEDNGWIRSETEVITEASTSAEQSTNYVLDNEDLVLDSDHESDLPDEVKEDILTLKFFQKKKILMRFQMLNSVSRLKTIFLYLDKYANEKFSGFTPPEHFDRSSDINFLIYFLLANYC